MSYTVRKVAELAGVSVRTLHHYDDIGLLRPAQTSPSGYRLYSDTDLERLQQILFFKEIGFSLAEIQRVLDHPGFDRVQALESQRTVLVAQKRRLEQVIRTVDTTLDALRGGRHMKMEEMFDGFDMSEIQRHIEAYEEEARARYGDETVNQSTRRTSTYTADDFASITAKAKAIYDKVAANMNKGPADEQVQEAVAQLRQHITDYYYDCTLEIFRGLGDLYVEDSRFTANIDKRHEGLASFLREAMHIYCDHEEK